MSKLLFYPKPFARFLPAKKNSFRKTCVADTATLKNVDPAFSKNAGLNLIHSKKTDLCLTGSKNVNVSF